MELTERELQDLRVKDGEVIVYGYLPMMVSAGCIQKTTRGCQKKSGQMTITDRYRNSFVVKNECDYCYNILYNYVPLYLGDRMEEVYQIGPGRIRLMFTTERQQEVRQILSAYFEGKELPRNVHQGTLEKRNKVGGILVNIIVELSKYLMIALMLVYTFECFAVFNYADEYTQRSIFRKQNVLMFLLHMIAFLVMYLQKNETK